MTYRFLADTMLGKLAKWLRVMGYDTVYRNFYKMGEIEDNIRSGRLLLSRNTRLTNTLSRFLLVRSDRVGDQLRELRDGGYIVPRKSEWFSRCLVCNVGLEDIPAEEARESVPEYVFYQNMTAIRYCPRCGRYFWPGSHRDTMIRQLKAWGF
ncbi:MAG: hypothetical protein JRJ85_00550 [Deltaproteobacteria bacterium]|nr:hypothetical protein [Deltaproteobacteria bacterium]